MKNADIPVNSGMGVKVLGAISEVPFWI